MTIREYHDYRAEEILPLYESVGWRRYTQDSDALEKAYANSLCVLAAWEGEHLAGVVRAVGDGVSIVFIQDILVRPEYQRRGIGRALIRALMDKYPNAYQIELLTDDTEKTAAFYKNAGFQEARAFGCVSFVRMKTA